MTFQLPCFVTVYARIPHVEPFPNMNRNIEII